MPPTDISSLWFSKRFMMMKRTNTITSYTNNEQIEFIEITTAGVNIPITGEKLYQLFSTVRQIAEQHGEFVIHLLVDSQLMTPVHKRVISTIFNSSLMTVMLHDARGLNFKDTTYEELNG